MTNPIDDPELYECVVLAGVRSPGKVTLSGHDREIDWDVKAASGQTGATTTLKGSKPCEFTATFYLVQDLSQGIDDFAAMNDFLDLVDSTVAGKTPKALDIYHPDLVDNGITSVVKKSTGGAVHDGKGGITYVVKFLEYKPPKPKGGSPNGSKTAAIDPDQAALDELNKLTNQYQKTPWG